MDDWSRGDTEIAEVPCQLWNMLSSGAPLEPPSLDLEVGGRHRQSNKLQRDTNRLEKYMHEVGLASYHAVGAVFWLAFTVLRLAVMMLNMLLKGSLVEEGEMEY